MIEDGLEVRGPFNDGYKYAATPKKKDGVMYRVPDVDWDKIPVVMGTFANVAAGAELTPAVVPAGKRWQFISAYINVTGGVADFYPVFAIDNGTAGQREWADTCTITAATATVVRIGPYSNRLSTGAFQVLPTPSGIEMAAGYRIISTSVTADDDYAESYYFYKEAPA